MIPAAQMSAIQRLLKIELVFIGIMAASVAQSRLRLGFAPFEDDLPIREAVADPGVEIDPLRKSAAQCVGNFMGYVGIDVSAAGRELDPQIALHLIIDEAADHA